MTSQREKKGNSLSLHDEASLSSERLDGISALTDRRRRRFRKRYEHYEKLNAGRVEPERHRGGCLLVEARLDL